MKNLFGQEVSDEKFEEFFEGFKKHIEKELIFKKRQQDRISKFIEKLTQEEIESWMDKFIAWENKYEEYCYNVRHMQTHSQIFGHLLDVLQEQGKSIRIYKDEDFCINGFKWNKYRFKLYQGQGAFWRIWKGRKVIFTNI